MAQWARSAARLLRVSSSSSGCRIACQELRVRWEVNACLLQKAADFHAGVGVVQWARSAAGLLRLSGSGAFRSDGHQLLPSGASTLLSRRGLATQLPAHLQKRGTLKLYVGSPGVLGDPYTRPPPPLPFIQRWFTKAGWQQRKVRIVSVLKTAYTIARLRQKTKGYSQKKFYREATDLYKEAQSISSALAAGDRSSLRHLVTDNVLSALKKELKHRENSHWARVHWELAGPIKSVGTVHGRLLGFDQKNPDNAFVQITLRILSNQKFAAYDKHGKVVAGDPDKQILVEDFWVFEKLLLDPDAKWKLCGRLSI